MNMFTSDAQQRALNFVVNQTQRIETETYNIRYREIQYPRLIPINTSGPEWISGVTYFTSDAVGKAKWFNGNADDVPHADVTREKFETTVSMAAIGYGFDLEEIGKAMLVGADLKADKASAARRASEEFIEGQVFIGDTTKGYTGIANSSAVTAGSAAATGTGATTTFSTKTAENILADINAVLTGMFLGTYGAEMADTLLLPYTQLLDLSTRMVAVGGVTTSQTILSWVEDNNIFTKMTGQKLTIAGVWGLETAGAGATARMVAYRRSPEVLELQMPMPFRFFPVWQQGPMKFEVPGAFRLGGVDIKRPKSMRYLDGI